LSGRITAPPGYNVVDEEKRLNAILTQVDSLKTFSEGYPRATSLLPARANTSDLRDLLRFEGHTRMTNRSNLCVAYNVACGLSPVVPREIRGAVRFDARNGWKFIDLADSYGIYVALYTAKCTSEACKQASWNGEYGLFEVVESGDFIGGFKTFTRRVLWRNPGPFPSEGFFMVSCEPGDCEQSSIG
jgi:hypothetical protein